MNKMTEKFFDPFAPNQTNMIPVILDRMKLFGITTAELSDMYDGFIEDKKEKLRVEEIELKSRLKTAIENKQSTVITPTSSKPINVCKKCGFPVKQFRVNVSKCTRVGGNYKIALQCTNRDCRHTEYK